MSDSELKLYIEKLLKEHDLLNPESNKLVMFFGLLGDFDCFEYISNALKFQRSKRNKNNKVLELVAIAIGTQKGKEKFCKFTGFPPNNLIVVRDNKIHNEMGFSAGLDIGFGGWINMILMLSGIGSPMTIKEVLRGYTGDKYSDQIFDSNEKIYLFNMFRFTGQLFNKTFGENYLRPLELATFRLNNMIEIIKNWDEYILNSKFLPQRGATFLLSKENEIIYKFFPKDLLCYSESMKKPMKFLIDYLD